MILEVIGKHFPARALEWYSGFTLLGWGGYVLLHPQMFTNSKVAGAFSGLAEIAWFWPPHLSWACVAIFVALARIVALAINGSRPVSTPRIRLAGGLLSALVWTQILVGLMKAEAPNPGFILYTSLVIADIYSVFRATRDVVIASRNARLEKAARGSHERIPSRHAFS